MDSKKMNTSLSALLKSRMASSLISSGVAPSMRLYVQSGEVWVNRGAGDIKHILLRKYGRSKGSIKGEFWILAMSDSVIGWKWFLKMHGLG
jgi:hypothetical protein